jgi:hypothetical protein
MVLAGGIRVVSCRATRVTGFDCGQDAGENAHARVAAIESPVKRMRLIYSTDARRT